MLIRAHEERLASLATPTSPGTCTAVGQEAAAVGVIRALELRDRILTNHRSAGHLLARGADPGRLMAEVMGRVDGYCKGKSGSLHVSAQELGVVLTSTIVGGELSLAPGVALAQKMGQQQPGGITAVFFGDGAACEGIFHESINLAVTWQLPLLYICENNQWQAFVRRDETMPIEHIADWARGHGIETRTVDGNDVELVHAAAKQAAAAVRATGKPYFLELTTYRQRGHFEPDDQAYVDAVELASWKARDPIALLRGRLLKESVVASGELSHLQQRVDAAIAAALDFAQHSPWPDLRELTTDVYA
ncbi:thiamine pyrophosphate-dependent dehydrogenase E1 component subunit alpha [Aquabacterium sp.]|uniref:thiamine pyrophosphate-dependent dehydrogenase E1 component subunit alpha n=1 Tax=Aquabacterium sp. TaxID=1872578 RepID=UPI002B94F207|nr:thiamine pyrophosphate-dependent dehydrogenase E1 component subunit alpha [Aquabacterium sp.]HSW07453.1 thiamine pyrophosphate-dependent dehydrogenase E1 component subunit alpha [Aquabacterium sp.]